MYSYVLSTGTNVTRLYTHYDTSWHLAQIYLCTPMTRLLSPRLFQSGVWVPMRAAMRTFGGLEIRGLEHVHALKGNAIFACNHTSQVDPVLLVACLPFGSVHSPLIFGSREKNYYAHWGWRSIVYGGAFFRLMGAYPIYSGLRDYHTALRHHIALAHAGHSICIFPAGFHTPGTPQPKARGGVGYLAHATALPVVPVLIEGVHRMSPWSFVTRRHRVRVTFGSPIPSLTADQCASSDAGYNPYSDYAHQTMTQVHSLH